MDKIISSQAGLASINRGIPFEIKLPEREVFVSDIAPEQLIQVPAFVG